MRIVYGDLVEFSKRGVFDVITHSCNCFCRMKRGIAPLLAAEFGCDSFPLEDPQYAGDVNKLGQIEYQKYNNMWVVNSYMQYHWRVKGSHGIPFDYDACKLCLRKINKLFEGEHLGLPMIGCGLAGANEHVVMPIIFQELKNMDVTLVIRDEDRTKFRLAIEQFNKGVYFK